MDKKKAPQIKLEFPQKIYDVLFSDARYKVLYGGRGSSKSWSVADYLILRAISAPLRILCAREYQNSIVESVHRLLKDRIFTWGLGDLFNITETSIVCKTTKTEFIFKGLAKDINAIRSMEGIDIVWIEEAVNVSEYSWDTLIPTIRQPNSQIIVTFNPDNEEDATYRMFVTTKRANTKIAYINYDENKFFPEVLRLEMEDCKLTDPDKYRHIWLGECCNFTGKIYKEYLRDKDVLTLEPIFNDGRVIGCIKEGEQVLFKSYWNYYNGLDTGGHTGSLVLAIDEQMNEYIIDEVYDIDGLVRDIATQIKSKCEKRNIVGKTIDSASQVKREYEAQGLYYVDSQKDVLGAIQKVRQKLSQHKLFVLSHCYATINEFKMREWEDKPNSKGKTMPKKENDHLMNALDYIQTTFLRADPPPLETPRIQRYRQTLEFKHILRKRETMRIG